MVPGVWGIKSKLYSRNSELWFFYDIVPHLEFREKNQTGTLDCVPLLGPSEEVLVQSQDFEIHKSNPIPFLTILATHSIFVPEMVVYVWLLNCLKRSFYYAISPFKENSIHYLPFIKIQTTDSFIAACWAHKSFDMFLARWRLLLDETGPKIAQLRSILCSSSLNFTFSIYHVSLWWLYTNFRLKIAIHCNCLLLVGGENLFLDMEEFDMW